MLRPSAAEEDGRGGRRGRTVGAHGGERLVVALGERDPNRSPVLRVNVPVPGSRTARSLHIVEMHPHLREHAEHRQAEARVHLASRGDERRVDAHALHLGNPLLDLAPVHGERDRGIPRELRVRVEGALAVIVGDGEEPRCDFKPNTKIIY